MEELSAFVGGVIVGGIVAIWCADAWWRRQWQDHVARQNRRMMGA